jgi:hypothetical protein
MFAFLFSPFRLYALPILSSLAWSFWLYLVNSTGYEAPQYAVLSSLMLFHPSSVQLFPSAPCFQHPEPVFFP